MTEEKFTDDINEDEINSLINRANAAESKNIELSSVLSTASGLNKDENFLHHQINTEEMLDKLEHFYRGDTQGHDEEGNLVWLPQKNKELVTFNEFGVTSLMEIITKYIDKNTILSYYSEQRVYEILSDIGDELVLFMLCNHQKIGMDTYFKKTKFRVIVVTTLHIIENTYRRALHGHTMEEINQAKVVGQFSNPEQRPLGPQSKRGGFLSTFMPK